MNSITVNKALRISIFAIFLLMAGFFSLTSSVNAQVNYGTYTPRTQAETIAYLQGVIAQLQAQLQLNQGFNYSNVQYQPTGQVQGIYTNNNTNNQTRDISVGTGFVRYDNNRLTLNGTVDLFNSAFANVWFEYGNNDRFGRSTSRQYLTRDGRYDAQVSTSRDDRYLYYRAVGQSPSGRLNYGSTRAVSISGSSSNSRNNNNDDEPDVETISARDIDEDSAELRGEVDMNDFDNGFVFFVYGEDENDVEDVEDEDQFRDIDERGDDLQKFSVDSDLDGQEDYQRRVTGLDDDTEYFFRICVEYEDDDDDDRLECGQVRSFETDRN